MKNTARTFQTFRQISCSTLYFLNVWRHNRSFLSKYLESSLELFLCARISTKLKYTSNNNSLKKCPRYLFHILHTVGRLKILKVMAFFNLKMFISVHDIFIVRITNCILPSARCDFLGIIFRKSSGHSSKTVNYRKLKRWVIVRNNVNLWHTRPSQVKTIMGPKIL